MWVISHQFLFAPVQRMTGGASAADRPCHPPAESHWWTACCRCVRQETRRKQKQKRRLSITGKLFWSVAVRSLYAGVVLRSCHASFGVLFHVVDAILMTTAVRALWIYRVFNIDRDYITQAPSLMHILIKLCRQQLNKTREKQTGQTGCWLKNSLFSVGPHQYNDFISV